eukprot:9176052-Alexandrium_andersonii.AAC.1
MDEDADALLKLDGHWVEGQAVGRDTDAELGLEGALSHGFCNIRARVVLILVCAERVAAQPEAVVRLVEGLRLLVALGLAEGSCGEDAVRAVGVAVVAVLAGGGRAV